DDPLAEVAAAWRAMWEVPGGPPGAAGFEGAAAAALAAWRDRRVEPPPHFPGITAGPPRGARPRPVPGPPRPPRPRPGRRRPAPRGARAGGPACWNRSGPWNTGRGGRRWASWSMRPVTSTPAASLRHSRPRPSRPARRSRPLTARIGDSVRFTSVVAWSRMVTRCGVVLPNQTDRNGVVTV